MGSAGRGHQIRHRTCATRGTLIFKIIFKFTIPSRISFCSTIFDFFFQAFFRQIWTKLIRSKSADRILPWRSSWSWSSPWTRCSLDINLLLHHHNFFCSKRAQHVTTQTNVLFTTTQFYQRAWVNYTRFEQFYKIPYMDKILQNWKIYCWILKSNRIKNE